MYSFTGRVNFVKMLLENGANRNLQNKKGETALAVAEEQYSRLRNDNYKQVVDLLKSN